MSPVGQAMPRTNQPLTAGTELSQDPPVVLSKSGETGECKCAGNGRRDLCLGKEARTGVEDLKSGLVLKQNLEMLVAPPKTTRCGLTRGRPE